MLCRACEPIGRQSCHEETLSIGRTLNSYPKVSACLPAVVIEKCEGKDVRVGSGLA